MIDADNELDNFRNRMLQDDLLPHNEIDDIIFSTLEQINEAILMSVSEAVAEVVDYAIEIGADKFLEDMDLIETGGHWMIATKSGSTDYSIPEAPMLPNLLKNAKTAEDGTKYKVIPVGKSGDRVSHRMTSLHDVLQRRQTEIDDARTALHRKTMSGRSGKANDMASEFQSIINRTLQERMEFYKGAIADKKQGQGPDTLVEQEFRTVTDRDDPEESWIQPGKNRDMSGAVADANTTLVNNHYEAVLTMIEYMEHQYLDLVGME